MSYVSYSCSADIVVTNNILLYMYIILLYNNSGIYYNK